MKYICKRNCFFRNRLWTRGETLEAGAKEVVPKHFEKAEGSKVTKPKKEKAPDEKPVALSELGKVRAKMNEDHKKKKREDADFLK